MNSTAFRTAAFAIVVGLVITTSVSLPAQDIELQPGTGPGFATLEEARLVLAAVE